MFIKNSHNRLKNRQNVVQNTKNQVLFSVSVPLFKNHFLKRDFFDSFNGEVTRVFSSLTTYVLKTFPIIPFHVGLEVKFLYEIPAKRTYGFIQEFSSIMVEKYPFVFLNC